MRSHIIGVCALTAIVGPAAGWTTDPPTGPDEAAVAAEEASLAGGRSERARHLLSDDRMFEDSTILWDGFLYGQKGFEHFYNPVGNPIYFESPLIQTGVRFLYLHHSFDDDSQLQGGDLNIGAVQVRFALTERLAFIATKDGYSWLDTGVLGEEEGWNDIAFGFKYAFYVDHARDLIATGGLRWMLDSGDDDVLQSGVNELSPFLSIAKGFDKLHFMASITDRIPLDDDDGNNVLQWDVHVDYELCKGIAPLFEIHGLHYLTNGERTPLSVGGLDYANLGSTDVAGNAVIWGGVGARVKLTPHITFGATYEFPFTDPEDDIFGDRVTVDFEITF